MSNEIRRMSCQNSVMLIAEEDTDFQEFLVDWGGQ